jgi:hypothetical protein
LRPHRPQIDDAIAACFRSTYSPEKVVFAGGN